MHNLANAGFLIFVDAQSPRLQIDAAGGGYMAEGCRRKDLARSAVEHVDVAIAFGPDEDFARLSVDRQVEQDLLVDAVVVVHVMRRPLVKPERLAGVGVAREDAGGPLVVAGTLI